MVEIHENGLGTGKVGGDGRNTSEWVRDWKGGRTC